MLPAPEVLKRSQYFTPPSTEHQHSSRTHYFDWEEYHRPLARMHHAYLHDWGIAGGLGVTVAPDGVSVEVQPGVAIDGVGELIALSFGGQADISLVQPGEAGQQLSGPFRMSTAGLSNEQRYLTIQFAERLRFGEGSGGKQEQTPWLRLQPTTGTDAYVDDGTAIILALVIVDAAGVITLQATAAGLPYGRRSLTTIAGALQVRRSVIGAGGVADEPAASFAPASGGGLRVSVPAAGDNILFQRQDGGPFAKLAIQADQTALSGDLHVQDHLQVNGSATFAANIGIGTSVANRSLTIEGTTESYLNLRTQVGAPELLLGVDANRGVISTLGDHDLHLRTSSNNPQLVLKADGNVGIGTIAPQAKLHIEAGLLFVDGESSGLIVDAGGRKRVGFMKYTGREGGIWRLSSQDFEIGRLDAGVTDLPGSPTTFTTDLHITGDGNVGIGTADPDKYKLKVEGGDTHLAGALIVTGEVNVPDTLTTGALFVMASGGGGRGHGSVGIGTSAPQAKLHIADGSLLVEGESAGVIVDDGGRKRVGFMKYAGREGGIWRLSSQDFEIGRLDAGVTELPGTPTTFTTDLHITGDGNVGIGTTRPAAKLDVQGDIRAGNSDLYFTKTDHIHTGIGNAAGFAAIENAADHNALMILGRTGRGGVRVVKLWDYLQVNGSLDITGNIGVGTANPTHRFHVVAADAVGLFESTGTQAYLRLSTREGLDNRVEITNRPGGRLSLWVANGGDVLNVTRNGNVGIGTVTPGFKLDVVGDVKIHGRLGTNGHSPVPRTPGWGGGIHTWDIEAEGTMWSRHGLETGNRDLAENFAAATALEPGDVVSLAPAADQVNLSAKANDLYVMGVVSTAPGVLLNQDPDQDGAQLFPIALCGRVPCKVVAENGPIQRGDLLTTSSNPGRAMKALPIIIDGEPIYRPGTIIGKALQGLAAGEGAIDIFVSLS